MVCFQSLFVSLDFRELVGNTSVENVSVVVFWISLADSWFENCFAGISFEIRVFKHSSFLIYFQTAPQTSALQS